MRIVSLLPSATELIAHIGLIDQLVGVSHSCDTPAAVGSLPSVTRTVIDKSASSQTIDDQVREHLTANAALYSLDVDLLETLAPDLIVSQALCDVCAVSGEEAEIAVQHLPHIPQLLNLEPFSLADVIETGRMIGRAAGAETQANDHMDALQHRIDGVAARTDAAELTPRRVVFLDWIEPPFVGGHWIDDVIRLAGGVSAIAINGKPSRTTSWSEIEAARPDAIIVACCGFTADRTREEIATVDGLTERLENYQRTGLDIHIFDGHGLFSNPGPRLAESLELLAHHLHPDIHPAQSWFQDYL